MTVVRSAMGTRLDCDGCDAHAATPSLSIETLRRATDYTHYRGRDYCPACQQRLCGHLPSPATTTGRPPRDQDSHTDPLGT